MASGSEPVVFGSLHSMCACDFCCKPSTEHPCNGDTLRLDEAGNVQVLDHAETVKKLSQQEALVTELQQHQEAHEASSRAAHKAKVGFPARKLISVDQCPAISFRA